MELSNHKSQRDLFCLASGASRQQTLILQWWSLQAVKCIAVLYVVDGLGQGVGLGRGSPVITGHLHNIASIGSNNAVFPRWRRGNTQPNICLSFPVQLLAPQILLPLHNAPVILLVAHDRCLERDTQLLQLAKLFTFDLFLSGAEVSFFAVLKM